MNKIKLRHPKTIVFFRHGHSLDLFESHSASDSERPLSKRGVEEVKNSASILRNMNINSQIIITSPRKRAVETSNIISSTLGADVTVGKELDGRLHPAQIWEFILGQLTSYDNLIITGHQPYLGIIAGGLLCAFNIPFSTAGFKVMKFETYLPTEIACGFAKEISFEKKAVV